MKLIATTLLLLSMTIATVTYSAVAKPANSSSSSSSNNNQQNISKSAYDTMSPLIALANDNKLSDNMTNILTEMSNNLRKLLTENKRLQTSLQETQSRLQNMTGINSTALMNTTNGAMTPEKLMSSLPSMMRQSTQLLQRFQGAATSITNGAK